jgi:hypothetical protein
MSFSLSGSSKNPIAFHFVPREALWLCAHVSHLGFLLCLSGIENASDIALYSGLGAAVVAVAVLVIGVTIYRRSQSDYGVDVIDSSALTGGFQTFNFKTVRQGQRRRSPNTSSSGPDCIHTGAPVFSSVLCESSRWP